MNDAGYNCGQCGGQCDICEEAERLDCAMEGEDMFLPRWLYLAWLGAAVSIILLAGVLLR